MVARRGWLRIVEAMVAVLLIFSSVLVVLYQNSQRTAHDLCSLLDPLLAEVSKEEQLRTDLLHQNSTSTEIFIGKRIANPLLTFHVQVCLLEGVCVLEPAFAPVDNQEVCARERIVSSTSEQLQPTRIKLFLFRKV